MPGVVSVSVSSRHLFTQRRRVFSSYVRCLLQPRSGGSVNNAGVYGRWESEEFSRNGRVASRADVGVHRGAGVEGTRQNKATLCSFFVGTHSSIVCFSPLFCFKGSGVSSLLFANASRHQTRQLFVSDGR